MVVARLAGNRTTRRLQPSTDDESVDPVRHTGRVDRTLCRPDTRRALTR
jgi:hypothetical protein